MFRKMALAALAVTLVASVASAQDPRVEIGANAGWTFSDGVSGSPDDSALEDYTRIDPVDNKAFGLTIGFFATPQVEVGFLWERQVTSLEIGGLSTADLGDFNIDNFHGYVAYNFGETDAKVRPFLLGGLGATAYGGISTNFLGVSVDRDGDTQFSSTWGAGLKLYPSKNVGIKLMARWTPTYIKSDTEGVWCDPWYGCYTYGDAQYSNQYSLTGGLTLRF